ncbi:HAD-IIIC family phosphatase [Catenulispora rubra]|uniref:HAD-IIIC family phosphatase n=1 Tax=Catenulispora rubra TaxID=280293 RepID=UPI00189278AC|nr:HAD-IIIC family phosphatase [Catenulispora rubra]
MTSEPVTDTDIATGAGRIHVLRSMIASGRLAVEYPSVRAVLAELDDTDLAAAGRVLARLSPAQVRAVHPAVPVVRVAITGHGVLADLVPRLTAQLARHGIVLQPYLSEFDSYVFDLCGPADGPDPTGTQAAAPEVTLCVLDPQIVMDELPTPWQVCDLERILEEKLALFGRLAASHAATSGGHLVFNTLPLPRQVTAQLIDHGSRAAAAAAWHEANARLLRLSADRPGLTVFDVTPWLAEGIPAAEPRLSRYLKAHLSGELLGAYAREAAHLVRNLLGRTRKVLAVDLDGTLWGGVVGDDGAEGVELGEGHRAEAFQAFQRVVKQIRAQGVLLTAVSKNDPGPVREVLTGHPGMVLGEQDFVRVVANWESKAENIRRLGAELNLGTDAFVFTDDSAFECGLIRHELPEVAVVPLDDEPALHIDRLLADGWFDTRTLTAEDRNRPRGYREELEREDFAAGSASIEDYLRGLELRVQVAPALERDLDRVSQITLRTNQFNLCTVRLSEQEVAGLAADPARRVLTIRSADRFGDNGMVGVLFTTSDGPSVRIENFLLSCRVFSRGIEQACLRAVLEQAREEGAREVVAEYRRTPKNGKVADLYPRNGFATVSDDGTRAVFRHGLRTLPDPVTHLRLTAEF